MQVLCPNCAGEGETSRDVWSYTGLGAGRHSTRRDCCEVCDGMGMVAALCSVCSTELDDEGDCRACMRYALEHEESYERPRPFVPSEEGALRIVAVEQQADFCCALCGVRQKAARTRMTVVSASRKATNDLCSHCVKAIREPVYEGKKVG